MVNELVAKRNDKFLHENKNMIFDILNAIKDKEKNKSERFEVKDLNSIKRLGELLKQTYGDKHLLFSNFKNHTTMIKIENSNNLLNVIHEFVSDLFEENYYVTYEESIFPRCLSFSDSKERNIYFLMNWDAGVVNV